jgi:TonB family protein
MKAQLFVLSAAALLLATAVQAAPSASERYIESTRLEAQARLTERGVDVSGKPLALRIGVGADRLSAVSVAKSSGSPELDAQAVSALRRLKTGPAPSELIGRAVVLSLGEPGSAVTQQ